MSKIIAEVTVPVSMALDEPFDYLVPAPLAKSVLVGSIVIVPFRNKIYRGYVRSLKNKSPYENRLKPILKVLDLPSVNNPDLLDLAAKIRDDCFCSFADALEAVLPQGLKRSTKISLLRPVPAPPGSGPDLTLTPEEKQKLELFEPSASGFLIHDLCGNKRWDVYAAIIKETLANHKSVIFLVPDHRKIAWALDKWPFSQRAIPLSSNQKPKDSLASWIRIEQEDFSFVIGTRSAIFAPVRNLGLIIVEEEEHFAYAQEQVPHYQARDIAAYRCQKSKGRIVFGSTTPSLETVLRAKQPGWQTLVLERKIPWPSVHIVDPDQASAFQGKRHIIPRAVEYRLAAALDKKEKILIFVSQKGFAGMLYCKRCKKTLCCPECSVPLKLHKKDAEVECPVCRSKTKDFDICPECKSSYVKFIGFGAEKISAEILLLFPQASRDIMIVSQSFLESADWAKQTFDMVYVPDADTMLSHTGFQTTEQAFGKFMKLASLATQDIYIQSRLKDHYVFGHLKTFDSQGFWERERAERLELGWPPMVPMGELQVRSAKEKKAQDAALACFKKLKKTAALKDAGEVLEPAPATPLKSRGSYRYIILIKSTRMAAFQKTLRECIKNKQSGVLVTFNPHIT